MVCKTTVVIFEIELVAAFKVLFSNMEQCNSTTFPDVSFKITIKIDGGATKEGYAGGIFQLFHLFSPVQLVWLLKLFQ